MRVITQDDITVLMQSSKDSYVKIQLLNDKFQIIDEIQGDMIDGDISIDSASDIRRTCNLSMYVKDNSLFVGENKRIWLDKYVRIYYGIKYQRTQGILWYPLGLYLFNDNSYEYTATSHTLTLSCVDLTSKLTGLRNGQIKGFPTQIPQGSSIRNSMILTITQFGGVNDYLIEDMDKEAPYDLSFSTGANVYDIVTKLRDLYAGWETFFDVDGVFICQPIPTCEEDSVLYDDSILKPLVISEIMTNSFSAVKNVTEVWGKTIEADRYADTSTYSSNTYSVSLDSFELTESLTIGFKANSTNTAGAKFKVNILTAYPIVNDEDQPIKADTILSGKSYVVRYRRQKFYFIGQFQIHAIVKEMSKQPDSTYITQDKKDNNCDNIFYIVNPDSPYTVEKLGEIRQVLSGTDYEKIYSDDLCKQRAEYENWKTTRLQDGMTLEIMGIPWIDVNQKLSYTANSTGVTSQYIVKAINWSIKTGMQTVECVKFYPLYPFIIS